MTTDPTKRRLITLEQGISTLLSYMFSGTLGPTEGKGVSYSVLSESENYFSFIAALEDKEKTAKPIHRYHVTIDRISGNVQPPQLISLSTIDLADVIVKATGHHLATSTRFTDGALSISYKVSVQEDPDIEYVVQLRHHGDVTSMNAVMQLVSSTVDVKLLPVPAVYPVKGKKQREVHPGMGIQIARFIPGIMGHASYPSMNHQEKLVLVMNLARAFNALWQIAPPAEGLIGELKAHNTGRQIELSVGPDRYHSLGGPFSSVAAYLRASIRAALSAFQKQQGIEEYKSRYLQRVTEFVEAGMLSIPAVVEQIPIVVVHEDMGLHNVIVSAADPTHIVAIIDWEFCSVTPYASLFPVIEKLFRKPAANGFGAEYPYADELRNAFWGTIPDWEQWNKNEATMAFLEWFRFAKFMKAEWRPDSLEGEEKEAYWAENVKVVEDFLAKYHS